MNATRWLANETDLAISGSDAEKPAMETLSPLAHYAFGIFLTLIGIVATVGNGTVVVVMRFTAIFRRKAQNFLLEALAWSDLTLSLLGYPMTAASSFSFRWIFGDVFCQLHGFLIFMLSMASMNTLVVIAIFRYIVICHPEKDSVLTMSLVKRCLLGGWVHAVVWTALPLLGWSSYTYEAFGTSCSINWLGTSWGDRSYVISTMVVCYILQVSIITFCYVRIIQVAKNLTFGWMPQAGATLSTHTIDDGSRLRKVKAEQRVTAVCLMMICAYLVMWTPYAVISLMSMVTYIPLWLTTFPTMFAKMACVANPVIYFLCSRRFRGVCGRLTIQPRYAEKAWQFHVHVPVKSRQHHVNLYVLCEKEFVTKDGVYIGKNKAFSVAEATLL